MLSNWLYSETQQTHKLALPRLFKLLFNFLTSELKRDEKQTTDFLLLDYEAAGFSGQANFMLNEEVKTVKSTKRRSESRQKRHQT